MNNRKFVIKLKDGVELVVFETLYRQLENLSEFASMEIGDYVNEIIKKYTENGDDPDTIRQKIYEFCLKEMVRRNEIMEKIKKTD